MKMVGMIKTVTRRETFSACHRLKTCGSSSEGRESGGSGKNAEVYGKCARRHGHNYVMEVSFRGAVDEQTGMLLDMSVAKRCIQSAVLDEMDHCDIDEDIAEFREEQRPSTVENIAEVIFQRLAMIPELKSLYKVRLWETEKISACVKMQTGTARDG